MTDNEIIKALEWLERLKRDTDVSEWAESLKIILNEYNRQKAEIERLQDENWLLKEQLDDAERLNYDMRDEIDVKLKVIDKLHEQIKTAKSEGIKRFWMFVRDYVVSQTLFAEYEEGRMTVEYGDNLVKEMTENDNGQK